MSRPFLQTLQPLVLASASPRRRQLLGNLGLQFTVHAADIEERPEKGELPEHFCARMAQEKARAVCPGRLEGEWVIGADTVVALDGMILGKPVNQADALRTLQLLSGRTHQVFTGLALLQVFGSYCDVRSVASTVCFYPWESFFLQAYIATGEPLDKAGAYGIQDIGAFLVREIHGSCSNVIGLPVAQLVEMLVHRGLIAPAHIQVDLEQSLTAGRPHDTKD